MAKMLELIQIIEAGRNAISDIVRGRQIKDQAATDEVHTAGIASLKKELEGLKSGSGSGAGGWSEVARVTEQISRDTIQLTQTLTSKSKLTEAQIEAALADFKTLSEKRIAEAEKIDSKKENQSPEAKVRALAKAEAEAEAEIAEAKTRTERAKRRVRKEAEEEKNDKIEKIIWISVVSIVLVPVVGLFAWIFCLFTGFPFGIIKWGVVGIFVILLAIKIMKILAENGERTAVLSEKVGTVAYALSAVSIPTWAKRLGIAGGIFALLWAVGFNLTSIPNNWLVGISTAYWLGVGLTWPIKNRLRRGK